MQAQRKENGIFSPAAVHGDRLFRTAFALMIFKAKMLRINPIIN